MQPNRSFVQFISVVVFSTKRVTLRPYMNQLVSWPVSVREIKEISKSEGEIQPTVLQDILI